jgi:hypothetical protein
MGELLPAEETTAPDTGVPTHWHEAFSTSFVVQALLSLQDEPI